MYMYIRKFISAILDIGSTEKIVHVHQYQKIQEKQLFSNTINKKIHNNISFSIKVTGSCQLFQQKLTIYIYWEKIKSDL